MRSNWRRTIRRASKGLPRACAQADKTRDAFYGANLRALTKVVTQLNQWRSSGAHDASVRSIAKQFDGIRETSAGDPQASACARLIQPVKE